MLEKTWQKAKEKCQTNMRKTCTGFLYQRSLVRLHMSEKMSRFWLQSPWKIKVAGLVCCTNQNGTIQIHRYSSFGNVAFLDSYCAWYLVPVTAAYMRSILNIFNGTPRSSQIIFTSFFGFCHLLLSGSLVLAIFF